MGHLQTVETDFRRLLAKGDEEALVRFLKDQVLASYRNGLAARVQAAGKEEPARHGASKERDAKPITS